MEGSCSPDLKEILLPHQALASLGGITTGITEFTLQGSRVGPGQLKPLEE